MKRIIPCLLLAVAISACQDDGPTVPSDGPLFDKPMCPSDHPSCKDGDGGTEIASASGNYTMVLWEGYGYPDGPDGEPLWKVFADSTTCEAYDERDGPCLLRHRTLDFSAAKYEDDNGTTTVAGEWRVENIFPRRDARGDKARGTITCFAIDEDQAWFGGTKGPQRNSVNEVAWRVNLTPDPDQSSLGCANLPEGSDRWSHQEHQCHGMTGYTAEEYCTAKPASLPSRLFDVDGNIILVPETP